MDGIYVFWYCKFHDDGAIVYYSDEDVQDEELYLVPKWLNLCYNNIMLKETYCDYDIKGMVEFCDNKVYIIEPVQFSYVKEGGGFKFEYYFNNVYDAKTKIEMDSDNDETSVMINLLKTKIKDMEKTKNSQTA